MNKLIKFSRESCVPCKMLGNFLDEQGIVYEEIDVESDIETTVKYGVSGLPTLLLVDENGEVLDRVVGFNPPKAEEMASQL